MHLPPIVALWLRQRGVLNMNAEYLVSPDDRILVTGSNGFVGGEVVETLLEYGFLHLRCFVRPSSRLDCLKEVLDRFPAGESVELISGDLLSRIDAGKLRKVFPSLCLA